MDKISKAVIGLAYGDEGKGLTTSYLCSKTYNPIVVRFNGGPQAGHTVVYQDKRHVFSGFGSGSLQNIPTYWSKFCCFYPMSFVREYKLLNKPIIYVNPLSPVITRWDIDHNRHTEKKNKHGSVGMGVGSTIQRQEDHYKLFVQDLFYETVLVQKLKAIANYYLIDNPEQDILEFLAAISEVKKIIQLSDDSILYKYTPIFEGAQGILLDMDFGFFPNVTRSNTTSKNAISMYDVEEIFYITRSYLTRHGNGFIPGEEKLLLKNNENETNKSHPYQGEFRTAQLDISLLNYSLACDNNFSNGRKKNLVITCMDQYKINISALLGVIETEFDNVYMSTGDSLDYITKIL
jgi:adenylosuccinate synthase